MEIDQFLSENLGEKKEKKASEADLEGLPEEVRRVIAAMPQTAEAAAGKKESAIGKRTEGRIEAAKPGIMKATTAAKTAGTGAKTAGDIDGLIAEANELISKGDFEGARNVYMRIKETKKELPDRFLEQEEKIKEGLVSLNEKIVDGMDRKLSTDFSQKFSTIRSLLEEAYALISDGRIARADDLQKAEDKYSRIKELYNSLPEGFMEKKVMVQDQMLKLYRILITNKKNVLYSDFENKSRQIIGMMKSIADNISRGNFEDASRLFTSTTELYKQLPKGFLKEKTDLQTRILDIYQKLIMGRENMVSTAFEKKASEINSLLSDAYSLVKSNRLKEAQQRYNRITSLFSKLPAGYFSRKADLEIEMMELHHMISLKEDKELMDETKAKIGEIESLLETAKNYMINKEYDLAEQVYDEVVEAYNALPHGFLEQNVKVQNRIMALYKDLLSHMHEPMVGQTSKEDKKRYDELLKLLVEVHKHVKRKEFGEIKAKYLAAYRIYHELPLSIIEEKKHLYKEIYRIYEELRLYTSLDRLSELAEKQDYKEMAALLDRAAEEYNILSKKYPQDKELFDHIHSKCLVYLEMLRRKDKKLPEARTESEVRKNIEEVARKKRESEKMLPVAGSSQPAPGKADAKGYLEKRFGTG